jgi:hypothetical protein
MMPLERYHPELHYMRGPGPKWRKKHAGFSLAAPSPNSLDRFIELVGRIAKAALASGDRSAQRPKST